MPQIEVVVTLFVVSCLETADHALFGSFLILPGDPDLEIGPEINGAGHYRGTGRKIFGQIGDLVHHAADVAVAQ